MYKDDDVNCLLDPTWTAPTIPTSHQSAEYTDGRPQSETDDSPLSNWDFWRESAVVVRSLRWADQDESWTGGLFFLGAVWAKESWN